MLLAQVVSHRVSCRNNSGARTPPTAPRGSERPAAPRGPPGMGKPVPRWAKHPAYLPQAAGRLPTDSARAFRGLGDGEEGVVYPTQVLYLGRASGKATGG